MIAYLTGTLLTPTDRGCILVTPGGVGYEVALTTRGRAALPAKGASLALTVRTIVREDAIELFGFASLEERAAFDILLTISKLGPKTGLAILSIFTPEELRTLVLREDVDALTMVPGIGRKSAQRIFVELKYKLDMGGEAAAVPDLPGGAATRFKDALAGLTNLGYDEREVRPVLEEVFAAEPDLDVASALRAALKRLAKARE
ncbi:MAG: Holliday junction branch migration protein RuvA [Thermodesulfobacteriota bacterium]